eukprot:gnl/TRDRNA2_/TRDRNA2_194800_c0_seq1.p1 gnl/TRDRNA2_/TRDRNA2_194800_c0~~gnl/TRDRNA2_/TRDRNA2_194800_c0_seq1.p1  ORF type:complete len:212 (+),score=24.72 gnl/TRDRNA2_/TRDRNA2_194800_c0_seq1:181-816(+)
MVSNTTLCGTPLGSAAPPSYDGIAEMIVLFVAFVAGHSIFSSQSYYGRLVARLLRRRSYTAPSSLAFDEPSTLPELRSLQLCCDTEFAEAPEPRLQQEPAMEQAIVETLEAVRDTDLYGCQLEASVRRGDFEAAARAARLHEHRAPRSRSGQIALLALAQWHARRQEIKPALDCCEAMRCKVGFEDSATVRAIVAACIRGGDMAQAARLAC